MRAQGEERTELGVTALNGSTRFTSQFIPDDVYLAFARVVTMARQPRSMLWKQDNGQTPSFVYNANHNVSIN